MLFIDFILGCLLIALAMYGLYTITEKYPDFFYVKEERKVQWFLIDDEGHIKKETVRCK